MRLGVAAADRLKTEDFDAVEVCKVGVWHPFIGPPDWVVTPEYLATLVRNTQAAVSRCPLKLGHNFEQYMLVADGLPNAGVFPPESFRVQGESLLADLTRVPSKIAALIQAGNYDSFSIETAWVDLPDGNRGEAITAIALLGEDVPAVTTLDDILEVYAARGIAKPTGELRAARADLPASASGKKPLGLLLAAAAPSSSVPGARTMKPTAKNDPTLKDRLKAGVTAMMKALGLEEEEEVVAPPPKPKAEHEPQLQAGLELESEGVKAARAEAAAARVAAAAAQAQVAQLLDGQATAAAEARVEALVVAGKLTPAMVMRDAQGKPGPELAALITFAKTDPAGFDSLWSKAPAVVAVGRQSSRPAAGQPTEGAIPQPTEEEIAAVKFQYPDRDEAIEVLRAASARRLKLAYAPANVAAAVRAGLAEKPSAAQA